MSNAELRQRMAEPKLQPNGKSTFKDFAFYGTLGLFAFIAVIGIVKFVNSDNMRSNRIAAKQNYIEVSDLDWHVEFRTVLYVDLNVNNPFDYPITNLRLDCKRIAKNGDVMESASSVMFGPFPANNRTWVEGFSVGHTYTSAPTTKCTVTNYTRA